MIFFINLTIRKLGAIEDVIKDDRLAADWLL